MTATHTTPVRAIVAEMSGHPAAQLDSDTRLDILGLDSLDRVTLAVRLEEHYKLPIPDRVLVAARTVGDLEAHFTPGGPQ